MSSAEQALEEFARVLVEWVRDDAIKGCDMNLRPEAQSLVARTWRNLGAHPADLAAIIPDIVDATLGFLFRAVDQEMLRLKYVASDGTEIELAKECDEPMVAVYDDWRNRFSKQRYVDHLAGLKFDFSSAKDPA